MTGKTKAGLAAGSLALAAGIALVTMTSSPTVMRANVPSITSEGQTMSAPRYAFIRIDDPGDAVRWEVIRGAMATDWSNTYWRASFPANATGYVLPVEIATPVCPSPARMAPCGPPVDPLAPVRVMVVAINAAEERRTILEPTRLVDLPVWSQVQ